MADEEQQPVGQQYSFTPDGAFLFTETWWKERGIAALDACETLEGIADSASGLLTKNNLGNFVEGTHMHTQFRGNIRTWVTALRHQATSARNLSEACFDAARIVATSDHYAATGIARQHSGHH